MAKVDFEKLYQQKKICGWLAVVLAANTVFKLVKAQFQGVVPYDAVITGALAAMCLLAYFLYSVKIERGQEAEVQRQIKRRRAKNRNRPMAADELAEWDDGDDRSDAEHADAFGRSTTSADNPHIASGTQRDVAEAKRPMLSGFPKWLAIGAGALGLLWGVMWISVNAHNWFDSPPPSLAEWDDVVLEISAVGVRMPESTGGKIESELGPEVGRVSPESEVRQHGSRAFFALRAEPVIRYQGWPKKELVAEARRKWQAKIALQGPQAAGRADPVEEIPQLSGAASLYGFRTHFNASSLANYRIEGLSILLPDGQALELQYWTKGENPAAEANAYFATLRPLANFGTPERANAHVMPRVGDIARPEPPAKQPEPDWNTLSLSELQKKNARDLTSEVPPPPPRPLTRKLLEPLPLPAKFESFRSGDAYAAAITASGYKDGWSKPVLMVIPDGLSGDPRYHTLLADFEATGFAVLVLGLADGKNGTRPFTGFLDESDQLNRTINKAFAYYQHGYSKEKFVIGFGSGGHLAGMGAVGINFGEAFASIDGGYVDFTGDAKELLAFESTQQAVAARTFVPHLGDLKNEFRLFVLDDDPQSSVQRTAAAIRASEAEFFDGRPPQYGFRRLSLIDVPSQQPDDGVARIHQCLRELLEAYAGKAGLEVKRDTSPATPAIAPEDAAPGGDFLVKKGTGHPPYIGPDKHIEDDKPPVTLPEGPPYLELLASPNRQLLRTGPPPSDKLPQENRLSELERDFRAIRGRTKVVTYDKERKLTGRFVRGENVRRGEPAPTLLYLHSGLASDERDIVVARPFIDAGFHVFCPTYRGEIDLKKYPFTAFLDEAEDATTAARWLAEYDEVDADHIYALGVNAGGHVAGLLSLRNVPIRSTASIDGVIDPESDGRGLFDVYAPAPEAHRLRSLVGNLGDMKQEHVLYFTHAGMTQAYEQNKDAGLAMARKLVTSEAVDRRKLVAWQKGEVIRGQPNRLEARSTPIGGASIDEFGSLVVDGRVGRLARNGTLAEQTKLNVELYLRRCQADVKGGGM